MPRQPVPGDREEPKSQILGRLRRWKANGSGVSRAVHVGSRDPLTKNFAVRFASWSVDVPDAGRGVDGGKSRSTGPPLPSGLAHRSRGMTIGGSFQCSDSPEPLAGRLGASWQRLNAAGGEIARCPRAGRIGQMAGDTMTRIGAARDDEVWFAFRHLPISAPTATCAFKSLKRLLTARYRSVVEERPMAEFTFYRLLNLTACKTDVP